MGYERVSGPRKLVVTEANSFAAAQRQFSDADFHRRELLPWYDHHLKGIQNGVMERAAVRVFVQGEAPIESTGILMLASSQKGERRRQTHYVLPER